VRLLLDALQAQPEAGARLHAWWQVLGDTIDATTLLADYGFSPRAAFISELGERLRHKLLPGTPETADAAELFSLMLPTAFDAEWLGLLDEATLRRLGDALSPASLASVTPWQHLLLEAITYCASQIRAAGFSPEVRLRMSAPARDAQPFHALASDLDALRDAFHRVPREEAHLEQTVQQFKLRLEACRHAAASVYPHLDAHGISIGLVFSLRQMRERVLRIRELLDCLVSPTPTLATARLFAHLVLVGQERGSLRALLASNLSLLSAKIAERSADTGEHYITRNKAEYTDMLRKAAGGGAATALTTWFKFMIGALGLAAFWGGLWSGLMYAVSFVFIQLMHWTLATKQPAMTAPAMAAKLKDLGSGEAIEEFVDEVAHLVRTQVAAVIGNVGLVAPCVVALSLALHLLAGRPMLNHAQADYVLHSLSLLTPSTLLFAAFTGVLLFASSLVAGWAENFFVLHRLDSAMRYNPRITAVLGVERAGRWAGFLRENISGFASNISLGFMLGLLPPMLGFFSLTVEVRHVTLSTGQLAAAVAAYGLDALNKPDVWHAMLWCAAALPLIGAANLAVSFFFAFRVALRAHNVSGVDRARIYRAIGQRLQQQPGSFLFPRA
jgi:site-specific recombinase